MRLASLVLLAASLLPVAVHADTYTYTYTGNPYDFGGVSNNGFNGVTGSLTLASPLVVNMGVGQLLPVTPLSFSFSDGFQTLTNSSPNLSQLDFAFATPASGVPALWEVDIVQSLVGGAFNQISSSLHPGGVGDHAYYNYLVGGIGGSTAFSSRPGTWTVTHDTGPLGAPTPEPESFVLVASGVLTLAARLRRRPGVMHEA